ASSSRRSTRTATQRDGSRSCAPRASRRRISEDSLVRAAHAAQRSKRWTANQTQQNKRVSRPRPLTPLRCVRGSEKTDPRCYNVTRRTSRPPCDIPPGVLHAIALLIPERGRACPCSAGVGG